MAFDLNNFWTSESGEHLGVAEKTFDTLRGYFGEVV